MSPKLRKLLFETLYKNRYLYRFASTVPFAGQWRVWQRLVLSRLRGHDILELGCGLGDLQADMLEAGYHSQAIEYSPQMVAAARDTLRKRNVGSGSTIIQGSAQKLPFANSSFDTVVSTFPTEYIYDPDTISEVERVLRPGGRVIIIEGANLLPVGFLQPFLVIIQALVYGPGSLLNPRKQRTLSKTPIIYVDKDTNTGISSEELPDAWFGKLIPLEQFGFRRRSERTHSRRWEVYITIGEKAEK